MKCSLIFKPLFLSPLSYPFFFRLDKHAHYYQNFQQKLLINPLKFILITLFKLIHVVKIQNRQAVFVSRLEMQYVVVRSIQNSFLSRLHSKDQSFCISTTSQTPRNQKLNRNPNKNVFLMSKYLKEPFPDIQTQSFIFG